MKASNQNSAFQKMQQFDWWRILGSDLWSKSILFNDYSRSQKTQELPLKWMAPESIKFNYYT